MWAPTPQNIFCVKFLQSVPAIQNFKLHQENRKLSLGYWDSPVLPTQRLYLGGLTKYYLNIKSDQKILGIHWKKSISPREQHFLRLTNLFVLLSWKRSTTTCLSHACSCCCLLQRDEDVDSTLFFFKYLLYCIYTLDIIGSAPRRAQPRLLLTDEWRIQDFIVLCATFTRSSGWQWHPEVPGSSNNA